jgi:hypothetical protein
VTRPESVDYQPCSGAAASGNDAPVQQHASKQLSPATNFDCFGFFPDIPHFNIHDRSPSSHAVFSVGRLISFFQNIPGVVIIRYRFFFYFG